MRTPYARDQRLLIGQCVAPCVVHDFVEQGKDFEDKMNGKAGTTSSSGSSTAEPETTSSCSAVPTRTG